MANPRPGRIRRNDPAGLRNRVLDAAHTAFQREGYAGASLQDLARQAQVTAGALHHHFPAKRDLALAVIAERVGTELADTWIAAMREAPDAATGITAVFDSVADALERQGHVQGCPVGNLALELSLADDGLREALAAQYRAWQAAIVEKLAADRAAGGAAYAGEDPQAFATTVVALFTGAMTVAKTEQSPRPLHAAANQLRRMMGPPVEQTMEPTSPAFPHPGDLCTVAGS